VKHEDNVIIVTYTLTGTYSAIANQRATQQPAFRSIFKGEQLWPLSENEHPHKSSQ